MKIIKTLILLPIVIITIGCGPKLKWMHQHGSEAEFKRDSYECEKIAQFSLGPSNVPNYSYKQDMYGARTFSQSLGEAIGRLPALIMEYNKCMESRGYYKVYDEQTLKVSTAETTESKIIEQEAKEMKDEQIISISEKDEFKDSDMIIKKRCEELWNDNTEMKKSCEKLEMGALATLKAGKPSNVTESDFQSIRKQCTERYSKDFIMRVGCERTQYRLLGIESN